MKLFLLNTADLKALEMTHERANYQGLFTCL